MPNHKNDDNRMRLEKIKQKAIARDLRPDWYQSAYDRFSISKARTDQLIDDIEKLAHMTNTTIQ